MRSLSWLPLQPSKLGTVSIGIRCIANPESGTGNIKITHPCWSFPPSCSANEGVVGGLL